MKKQTNKSKIIELAKKLAESSPNGFSVGNIIDNLNTPPTRQYIHKILTIMVAEGGLITEGEKRSRIYKLPGDAFHYDEIQLSELASEEVLWKKVSEVSNPWIDFLPRNAYAKLQFIFTEMINNVIDHSGASKLRYGIIQDGPLILCNIIDDGIGAFEKVRAQFDLDDHYQAAQKIMEGRTTTMASHHSGEGLFFSSKSALTFSLRANGVELFVHNGQGHDLALRDDNSNTIGTTIHFVIDSQSPRKLSDVFAEFTDQDTFAFNKTQITVQLYTLNTHFVSRSEAKRIITSLLEKEFTHITFNYHNVESIGQGFADEIYRVFAQSHPTITIESQDMNTAISAMINHVKRKEK